MTITAWRIVKRQHAARAFDGEGARLFGGRWNSPGFPVVYASSSRSLAALEMAVHLDRSTLLASFVLISCEFDARVVTTMDRRTLPAEWRRDVPPPELAAIGDLWIRDRRSVVLAVPSAVIEEEMNFLLNPAHERFSEVRIGAARSFEFDSRRIK